MNSSTLMEQYIIAHNDCNNKEDDALSLKDLQMYDQTATSSTRSSPRTSSAQEPFEFSPILSSPTETGDIMFCGKLISDSVNEGDKEELNDQYQNHNYLRVAKSSSFRLHERPIENAVPMRSVSNRDLGSSHRGAKFSTSKSKRRMCMFGPVKFMPQMEIRSIRERQGCGGLSRMFPMAEGGGDGRKAVAVTVRVSCRARLNSMFERSLACLRN